ncbi:hypothetical protein ACHAWF_001599 [Thalassiosira exigua]
MASFSVLCVVLISHWIQASVAVAQSAVETEASEADVTSNADADADPSTDESEESMRQTKKLLAPFSVRLHLVRHGETQANVQNLVLGQGDSPLTEQGVAVARLAAASDSINGRRLRYWRTYCSDLHRAHRTARIVLGMEGEEDDTERTSEAAERPSEGQLIVDSRLRELAKGAREGFLKKISYEMALELRRRDAEIKNKEIQVPKLEKIDHAWERVEGWINSLVKDASDDFYSTCKKNGERDDPSIDDSSDCEVNDPKRIYDVFALSHSALIRTMIHKMVGDELPPDYAKTKEGSLSIPNLSRTTIDVRPYTSHPFNKRWEPSLLSLTDVSHLHSAPQPQRTPSFEAVRPGSFERSQNSHAYL